MNIVIEQEFIKKYIDKGYQERLLLELGSAKRRTKALSRFSHNVEEILNKNTIKKTVTNFSDIKENDKTVYIISWDKNDGTQTSFADAIKYCEAAYTSVVLIGKTFALIKEETEGGTPKIFYLKNHKVQ
ncbi:MAG: hypothetical protein E7659_07135 [Ruminococcaceae bacterium]|nr:hypothetical protein [Oscillospiraceae bacterium]